MPRMDGRELLKEIAKNSQFKDLKVIILTGYMNMAETESLTGAYAVLVKPIEEKELIVTIEKALAD